MSKTVTLKSYAKINLALDITNSLENGYHEIATVFQSISLCDMVSVSLNNKGIINVCTDNPLIPSDKNNIAFKAAEKFFEYVKCCEIGADIKIWKGIPSQAGLGGGSSDAAAVLKALNILTAAGISDEQLCSIGALLGADVPFCINGGTAYAEGIGEKLTALPPISDYSHNFLCIAKGNSGISTAEAYKKYDIKKDLIHPDIQSVCKSLENKKLSDTFGKLGNIFEQLIDSDDVRFIKKSMLEKNALASLLTGSGSAVFGIFRGMKDAGKCVSFFKNQNFFSDICTFKNCGSELI